MNPEKPIGWFLKNEWIYVLMILLYFCWHQYFFNVDGPCFSSKQEEIISGQGIGLMLRSLDEVLQGHVFFKDFYWWYGPGFLYLIVPFYYFTGANIGSICLITELYLPIIALVMSYIYIRLLLRSPTLRILFVIVCSFHIINTIWPSPRHFAAELALAVFMVSLEQLKKARYAFISGLLAGNAILFSYEYGLPATTLIFLGYLFFVVWFKERTTAFLNLKKYIQGLVISLAPFVLYMIYNGVFVEYIRFMADFVRSIAGGGNVARGQLFPVFPEISFSTPFIFIKTALRAIYTDAFLFYFPLITYVVAFLVALFFCIKKQYIWVVKLSVLAAYGFIVYIRTLSGPNYSFMAYGLVPAVTLGFFFLEYSLKQAKYHYNRYNYETYYNKRHLASFTGFACFLVCSMIWFCVTLQNKSLFSFPFTPDSFSSVGIDSKRIYYDKVGFEISSEAYDQYTHINEFIEKNTLPSDYLLVYPWGPYNHFTGRIPPFKNHDVVFGYFLTGNFDKAIERLEEIKPRYIILNTSYMNLSIVKICSIRHDVASQLSWRNENSPCFAGNGDPMQIYLLENYHLVKQTSKDSYKYAAILERNQNKKPFNRTFASTSVFPSKTEKVFIKGAEISKGGRHFKINSRKVRIEYVLKNPVYASHFKVKLLLKTNFLKKYFTKTRMTIGIIASGESIVFHYDINDLGDLGTVKTELQGIFVPRKDLIKKTDKVWIELDTPEPYLIPEEFEVLELTALLDERIGL